MSNYAIDPGSLISWLSAEITEASIIQEEFNKRADDTDYDNLEQEIERHEQDGFVMALEYVLRKIEEAH